MTPGRVIANPSCLLCVDFVNTLSWRGSEQPVELFESLTSCLRWLHDAGALDAASLNALDRRKPVNGGDRLLAGIVDMREQLHELLAATVDLMPEWPSLDLLARWLETVPVRRHLSSRGKSVGWRLPVFDGSPRALLTPVIWSAADLLLNDTRSRLRLCDNHQCRRLFIDDSKVGNRRWCSMSACGNRAKARRHYLRKTASGG